MENRKLKNEELGRLNVEEFQKSKKSPIVIVLDNVRSLHNIGSIFRTSDAFAAESIYLCGITGTPPNKDIAKSALGATESVNWRYFENTTTAIQELKQSGWKIISIEQTENSISLKNFTAKSTEKYAIVFGHEIKGVDQNVINASDFVLEIPQFGTKHSFNVSVTAGIVLWEIFNNLQ